jgi:protocatechuate 3,4-dioxygenase beta subunit
MIRSLRRQCITLASTGLLVTLFIMGSRSSGQQLPASPQPAATASNEALYRISGKVVDAHTGSALARCSVRIADVKDRGQSRTINSGDDGSFVFQGLSPGKYALTAERRGYLEQSYEEHEQFSTAIAVGPGLDSGNLTFKLTAEAVLAGTITDESGEPIRGAQVRLFEDEDRNGIRNTRQRHSVVTDDRGMYELTELRPGAYFLVVTAHPWYAQGGVQPEVGSERSSEIQALDVAYPTTFYPGVTDQDQATPIPVKGGDRLEANLTLAAQPALRLHLNQPSAQPPGGISVMLTQSIFGQVENVPTPLSFGPGGAVEIDGVLPGHYDVAVNQFTPGDQGRRETKHFEADVADGTTQLTEDNSLGEVTVTGKVTTDEGKLPESAGISLCANLGRRQHGALIDAAGNFSMAVPPGTYEVLGSISGMHIASLQASGAALTGRTLIVKADDSPKLTIVAGSGHGEIEGVVLHGTKPSSGVLVLLAPEDPKNNQVLFSRDQSDSDGSFTLANIFPGKYHLLAIDNGWDLEWANPAVLQAFLKKSTTVEVHVGDHLKNQVQVQER